MHAFSTAGLLLIVSGLLAAQSFTPRTNFGARLEPQDGLMHGAGQSPDAFAAYWSAMPNGSQPTVYMHYITLKGLTPDWADNLKSQLMLYPDSFILPQIGLSMTDGVTAHYEQQVADGAYDEQIGNLVAGLRTLATPVYLRIGYEFNGLSWNGYLPAPYKQAFTRITNALRATPDIEVATVWDAEIDGVKNFFDYYPGDDYVDWFGINIFSSHSFQDSALLGFLAEAAARNKPMMIGETTPQQVGAQNGPDSWTGWYAGFFNFLQANPGVKQFNYIDWDWAYWAKQLSKPWGDWGDARLETDAAYYVRGLYTSQLTDPVILHATSESAFRQRLGFNDTTVPDAITDLNIASVPGGAQLSWTPADDASGIARYYIFRNGSLLDFTLSPPYTDLTATLGTSAYSVAIMDRAGNLGRQPADTPLILDKIERLKNGDFEAALSAWRVESFSTQAVGSVTTDTLSPIDGSSSATLSVSRSTGTDWHLQLRQFFAMTKGLTYTVRFKARASAPVSIPFAIQQIGAPNAIYLNPKASVGVDAKSYQYSFVASATQMVAASYFFANLGNITLWLDDISIEESNPLK